jgi:NDP-sugar pyrophosphorylase family protein
MQKFFSKLGNRLEKFVGDYPTFIEPVYLEDNVKIGDDVLLGPNVYIGANSEIQDYVEMSNTIIFENVIIGENFKLENCVVAKDSSFKFKNLNLKNSVLIGETNSKDELQSKEF